jgi:hypothetical protein
MRVNNTLMLRLMNEPKKRQIVKRCCVKIAILKHNLEISGNMVTTY